MRQDLTLIRTQGRAAMIKAQIDAARLERKSLRKSAYASTAEGEWNSLIRQWKHELRELTGEEY